MRDSDSALGHHLGEVVVARLIGDIPSDTENDDRAIKVATAKQGRCVRERLIHVTDYQPDSAFAPEPLGSVSVQCRYRHLRLEPSAS